MGQASVFLPTVVPQGYAVKHAHEGPGQYLSCLAVSYVDSNWPDLWVPSDQRLLYLGAAASVHGAASQIYVIFLFILFSHEAPTGW